MIYQICVPLKILDIWCCLKALRIRQANYSCTRLKVELKPFKKMVPSYKRRKITDENHI